PLAGRDVRGAPPRAARVARAGRARPRARARAVRATVTMRVDAHDYASDALLRDGSSIHLRAIRPADKERLQAHFAHLGLESVRFRFLGMKKELTPGELAYFTELDFSRHVGLAATRGVGAEEEFIGVGRYICGEDDARTAEFALAVVDGWQGRGV